MNASINLSRRNFLRNTGCAAMSSVSVMNTLLHLNLATRVAASTVPTDRRTLVCIYLGGGMDSFNVLVPRDARHAVYAATRGNLTLPTSGTGALLPLTQAAGGDGLLYGVHPNCGGLQELFNGIGGDTNKRRLAWVANTGTLIQPTSKTEYENETVPLPRSLFSHSDQQDQWMTSVPQGMTQATGWAGRTADLLNATVNDANGIGMNLSFAGNNLWQVGANSSQFVGNPDGALTFTAPYDDNNTTHPMALKNAAHESLMAQTYNNLMQQSYANLTKASLDQQRNFETSFNNYNSTAIDALFPANYYGDYLKAAVKAIALRPQLGVRRQTILVNFGGWDHHDDLLGNQQTMFTDMIPAILGFQKALELLTLQDSVITYTATEFSRTLRSNGRGTDHAWGGNPIVMGGPVQGGRIYGTYPDLTLDSNDDVGYGGRLLPSTSVDQLFGEMLRWFGVAASDLATVLPNIGNFYTTSSSTLPLGFVKAGTWV